MLIHKHTLRDISRSYLIKSDRIWELTPRYVCVFSRNRLDLCNSSAELLEVFTCALFVWSCLVINTLFYKHLFGSMLSSYAWCASKCLNLGTLGWLRARSSYLSCSHEEPYLPSSRSVSATAWNGGSLTQPVARSWGGSEPCVAGKTAMSCAPTWCELHCVQKKVFGCSCCLLRHLLGSYVGFPFTVFSSCCFPFMFLFFSRITLAGKDLYSYQVQLLTLALPNLLLNHDPKHHIHPSCESLQGWWLNHFHGQPIPVPNNLFGKEFLSNIQSKLPLVQL